MKFDPATAVPVKDDFDWSTAKPAEAKPVEAQKHGWREEMEGLSHKFYVCDVLSNSVCNAFAPSLQGTQMTTGQFDLILLVAVTLLVGWRIMLLTLIIPFLVLPAIGYLFF
jgi:hypothetical protein